MGCVQQAVLEFDAEVRVPWRPRLVSMPLVSMPLVSEPLVSKPIVSKPLVSMPGVTGRPAPVPRRQSSRQSPSRVGACRPAGPSARRAQVPDRPAGPSRGRAAPVATPVAGNGRCFGSGARARSTRVRFTRRARRLAVVLALCGGVVLGSWMAPLLAGDGGEVLRLAGERTVVVQPGDTLWSLATSVAGGDDVRMVVDRIQELNGLDGADLVPGQVLQLP